MKSYLLVFSLSTALLVACDNKDTVAVETQVTPEPTEQANNDHSVTDQVMNAIAQNVNANKGAHDAYDPHTDLSVSQLIKVAIQHHQEGRTTEAFGTLNDAIYKHPQNAELFFVQSQLYAMNGSATQALDAVEQAIRLDAKQANYYINRAQLYRQFGRNDAAMKDLDFAVSIDDTQVASYFNRGALKYATQDFEGALEDFNQCIAIDPHESAPYFNRAAIYNDMGKKVEAKADLERFLQMSDNAEWNDVAKQLLTDWQL